MQPLWTTVSHISVTFLTHQTIDFLFSVRCRTSSSLNKRECTCQFSVNRIGKYAKHIRLA